MAWSIPQLNYSSAVINPDDIGSIGTAFTEAQDRKRKLAQEQATRQLFAGGIPKRPDGSPDYSALAGTAFGVNPDLGMGLTRLAEVQSQNAWQRSTDTRDFDFQQQEADRDLDYKNRALDASNQRDMPAGYVRPPEGEGLTFEPGGPADPAVIERNNRARRPSLTASDRKAVMEADDTVMAGENTVQMLKKALQLNEQALSGPAARQRGYIASNLPDALVPGDKKAAIATEELNNVVTAQALETLRAIFGGMPTEGERKILLEIQGSVNQAPEVRKDIYTRAMQLAERRIQFNRERAQELRGGTYYNEDGSADLIAGPAQDGGQPPPGWTPEEWNALSPEERASIQ